MRVVPIKIAERIQFFQTHGMRFAEHAAEIGITPDEAAELQALTAATREAWMARERAQQAAEAATLALRNADEAMSRLGAGLIKKIRARADLTGNELVYSLAWLPAPARPSPVGAPGVPSRLGTKLRADGSLELTWRCDHPAGCTNVIYQLYRKTDADRAFAYVGGTGERRFVDLTLPAGTACVVYRIQATRSTAVGYAADFDVNFGTAGATMPAATVAPARAA